MSEPIEHGGAHLWGECEQFPVSAWNHEVDAGRATRGYWPWVLQQATANGVAFSTLLQKQKPSTVFD